MITIKMTSKKPLNRNTLLSLNHASKTNTPVYSAQTILSCGTLRQMPQHTSPAVSQVPSAGARRQTPPASTQHIPQTSSADAPPLRIPPLLHPVQKGQKISIETASRLRRIKACFGWNTLNGACDVDVSAFLLDAGGTVIGDSWFVFYGQETSPDQSTVFCEASSEDREYIRIDFDRLNPNVSKIVFVLTIHEALEHCLHFGMLKDAYVRILNEENQTELVSFQMTEYYTNVISMMIGEIYRHNGAWKFHAVGNGVARDLAGLCALYGVQVSD